MPFFAEKHDGQEKQDLLLFFLFPPPFLFLVGDLDLPALPFFFAPCLLFGLDLVLFFLKQASLEGSSISLLKNKHVRVQIRNR